MICFDIKLPEPIVLSVLSDAGAFEPEDISDGSLSPGESHEGSQEGCGVLRRSGEGELDSALESAVFDGVSPALVTDRASDKPTAKELITVQFDMSCNRSRS